VPYGRTVFSRSSSLFLSSALLVSLAAGIARGQQSPASPAQPSPAAAETPAPAAPAVRVTTRLVQIGVIVHDKNGPVSNLTQADFTVFDRGKLQPISTFSVVSHGSTGEAPVPLPPNTFSDLPLYNAAAPGSITIVLLDNLNTLSGAGAGAYEQTPLWLEDHALANAKAHLLEYLQNLEPGARVAVYGLSRTLHVLCDFTSDRERLLAIVKNYDARSLTSREVVEPAHTHTPGPGAEFDSVIDIGRLDMADFANEARATVTMAALQAIADHVAHIPGRKNLIWLTANLPLSGKGIAAVLGPAQIAAYPVDGRGLLPRSFLTNIEGNLDADELSLGNGGRQMQSAEPTGIAAMQDMADLTGGKAFVNGNDLTTAIREAVNDAAVFYLLGFYIDAKSADGRFHELKVALGQKGLDVRYPKGYFALGDAAATDAETHNNLITAVRSPIDSSSIPLRVHITRVVVPAPNSLLVEGRIDAHELRLEEKGKQRVGAVEVIILEQDGRGKILAHSTNRLNLRMQPEQYAGALATGIRFEKHVEPKPETTTLRILVQDRESAQIGSVIIPLSQIH